MPVATVLSGMLAFTFFNIARVTRIIDGDTFVAEIEVRPGLNELRHVRLACGSAPELSADGGFEAKSALASALIKPDGGSEIRIATNWRQEKYGRLLGDPYVPADGGFYNVCEYLRQNGYVR